MKVMAATRHFTFKFPNGVKLLPKRIQYEIVQGGVGLITTDDPKANALLDEALTHSDGGLREISAAELGEILKPLRLAEHFKDPPSFMRQTQWQSGTFDLPYKPGTCYFNSGIESIEGRLHLFTRRYRYKLRNFGAHFGVNDLAVCPLTDDLKMSGHLIVPIPPGRFEGEQWEDPRAMIIDGQCYVGMATYVHGKRWSIRQSLVRMADDLSRFSVFAEVDYGGNASTPERGTEHEKNWLWFQSDGDLQCVYTLEPMRVFSIRNGDQASESVPIKHWRFGRIRGGSPPVRIDDEFLLFFHSSRPWVDEYGRGRRRYYMGALTMTVRPPFRLTSITPNPLLIGSHHDIRELSSPLVVFPCGAKLIDNAWLVTMGINDERCGWIKIPHAELCKLLKPL